MYRGRAIPPALYPVSAFCLWIYLFFSYLEVLQTGLEFPRQIFSASLLIVNLILVLVWFLCGKVLFVVFAAALSLLTVYVSLVLVEGGLWVQVVAFGVLYLWLHRLSGQIEDEKRIHMVNRERIQADLNLSTKGLGEKEHLLTALQRKLERLNYLREFSDHLRDKSGLKEMARVISMEVAKLIPASDQVLLFVIDPKTQELGLVIQFSREGRFDARAKKGDEFDEWVMRRSQPLLIEDLKTDFRFSFDGEGDPPFRSLCIVPLISERKTFALLHLNAVREGAFHTEDLRFLDIVADLSAVSLRNVLLYEQTRELAIVDSLTECYLFRYVQDRITEEILRSLRNKVPFAVVMADIDHFKAYNDTFGHTAGDVVLRAIAEILRTSVGPTDIVGRYGGEEFILVLPQKDMGGATHIAETIRGKVQEREFHTRRETRHVTLSLGISVFPDSGTTREELLWKADKNLYEAKRKGRNQTCAKI